MPLIPLAEVAARAGVSRTTIERMMARGEFIAAYQLPTGTLRFDSDEFKEWLAQCRRTDTTTPPRKGEPAMTQTAVSTITAQTAILLADLEKPQASHEQIAMNLVASPDDPDLLEAEEKSSLAISATRRV